MLEDELVSSKDSYNRRLKDQKNSMKKKAAEGAEKDLANVKKDLEM